MSSGAGVVAVCPQGSLEQPASPQSCIGLRAMLCFVCVAMSAKRNGGMGVGRRLDWVGYYNA
jgi:hypothetical protein